MSGLRRLPLIAVILASTIALLLSLPSPPAAAVDVVLPSVQVVIDSLSPEVVREGDVLRVRGRLVSSARTELTDVSVQMRRSPVPMTSRKDVATVQSAGLEPVDGEPAALAYYGTRREVTSSLAPGSTQDFSLKVPISELGLPTAGTYVIAIEALGSEAGVDASPVRKGIERTFLPWYPTPESIVPIELVWLWPLADWPARTATGLLLNDRTPTELSPGGRLDRLLTVGERFRGLVSWIADPALLEGASDMSEGYQVLRDGSVSVGDREEQAARWLERLAEATRGAGLRALPYGDIDASAVTRADMSNDVVRAVTQGPGIATAALGAPVPGNLYWAPFGRIDRSAANVLASAGVTDLILSADALPPTDEAQPAEGLATAALPTSVGTIRAVLADPGLSDILALPQRTASDVIAARQQFLAETALIAEGIPVDQVARTVVVAPHDVRWNPSASFLAPLLAGHPQCPVAVAEVPRRSCWPSPASTTSRQRGGYGDKARQAELGQAYMASVRRTTQRLECLHVDPRRSHRAERAVLRGAAASGVGRLAHQLDDRRGARAEHLRRARPSRWARCACSRRAPSPSPATAEGSRSPSPMTSTGRSPSAWRWRGIPSIRLQSEPLDRTFASSRARWPASTSSRGSSAATPSPSVCSC